MKRCCEECNYYRYDIGECEITGDDISYDPNEENNCDCFNAELVEEIDEVKE
jgi:hypothetical protein